MTRRKFTAKFKTEVALAAIKEQKTTAELIKKYELTSQQINLWKREFLSNAVSIFASSTTNARSEADEREAQLLQTIGELKVENDFLKKNLK